MNKILFTLLFITLSVVQAYGQVARGKVENNNHEPLIGATVLELGTQNGIITDEKGLLKSRFLLERHG